MGSAFDPEWVPQELEVPQAVAPDWTEVAAVSGFASLAMST